MMEQVHGETWNDKIKDIVNHIHTRVQVTMNSFPMNDVSQKSITQCNLICRQSCELQLLWYGGYLGIYFVFIFDGYLFSVRKGTFELIDNNFFFFLIVA